MAQNRKVYKHNTYAIYISKMKINNERNQEKNRDVQAWKAWSEADRNERV